MPWSSWTELSFDAKGKLNTAPLSRIPNGSGIYAIATKTGRGYNTHYVGRSKNNLRGRLQAHLSGRGNKVIANLLKNKQERPTLDPTQVICVAYLATKEPKLLEAAYLDARDLPLGNLIRARLPQGLREQDVFVAPLEP